MCIIVSNPDGKKLPEHVVDNCVNKNPDGFAIYYLNDKKLYKTMDKEKFRTHLSKETPFVAHCRFKTQGKVCLENVHLFEEGSWLFAMNGTVKGFRDRDANDTRELIKLIKLIPDPKDQVRFLRSWEARFLIVDRNTNTIIRTGKWLEKDGVYYSKENVLEEPRKKHEPVTHGAYGGGGYDWRNRHNGSSHTPTKANVRTGKQNYLADYDAHLGDTDNNIINNDHWIEVNGVMTMTRPLFMNEIKEDAGLKKNQESTAKETKQDLPKEKERSGEGKEEKTDSRVFGFVSGKPNPKSSVIVGDYGQFKVNEPSKTRKILTASKYIETAHTTLSYGMVISPNMKPYLLDRIKPMQGAVEMELYIVSSDDLKELDVIMKYPHLFSKKQIPVETIGNMHYMPWVYVLRNLEAIKKLDNNVYFNKYTLEQEEKCLSLIK